VIPLDAMTTHVVQNAVRPHKHSGYLHVYNEAFFVMRLERW
jgi:hypothetical protein